MDLDIEVARLRLLKADYQSQHYRLEDSLAVQFPQDVTKTQEAIGGYKSDLLRLASETKPNEDGFSPMTIHGKTYTEKSKAGEALLEACGKITDANPVKIGSYRGFDLNLSFGSLCYKMTLKGSMGYQTSLGSDIFGNITRIDNALNEMPAHLKSSEAHLENLHRQIQNAKLELGIPFQSEQELAEKSRRLAALDAELNMDGGNSKGEAARHGSTGKKNDRQSILENLRANIDRSRQTGTAKSTEVSL